jgi:hypothetical protein
MKRWFSILPLLLAALAFAAAGAADDGGKRGKDDDHGKSGHHDKGKKGDDDGKGKRNNDKFGPFLIHTTDNGSCGNTWANDTIQRTLYVKKNKDGTFRVLERDRGTFVTNAGGLLHSPGACNNGTDNGHKVRVGVQGTLEGFITGTITGGTFNPNATCTANPCGQGAFIAAFFGPTAKFSCFENSSDCAFDFKYRAKDQNLKGHSWRDRGTGAGTQLHERFSGDIYDLP